MIKAVSYLDPRSALIGAFLLSIGIACLNSVPAAVMSLALCAPLLFFSGSPWHTTFKRLLAANAFILFIWLVVPWTMAGPVIFKFGFFEITAPGLRLCILATLKANAIFCVFMVFIFPLSVTTLGSSLRKLGFPQKFVWIMLLMGSNVEILKREWSILASSVKLRGFRPGNNPHTYKTLAAMLAIFLIHAHARSEKTREAMLLRGFSGKLPIVGKFKYGWRDAVFLIGMAAMLIILIILETES